MSRLLRASWLVALTLVLAPVGAAPPPRVVAVADVHGADEPFAAILQRAGLIDAARQWTGGTAVLVQTGDLLDRGTGVRAILDLLMALEPQAAAAGGRVQALVGNHEAMNMVGDTRDVAPELIQGFADDRSEARREEAFQAAARLPGGASLDKAAWLAAHPPGFLEYRAAFAPDGPYGRWLRSKPVAAEIAGTAFLHGGINPAFTTDSIDSINRRARRELQEWDDGVRWLQAHDLALPLWSLQEIVDAAGKEIARIQTKRQKGRVTEADLSAAKALIPLVNIGASSLFHPDGPLWFRGYSKWTDAEGAPLMAGLLRRYRVRRFVTGHTPQPEWRITSRFGGTLFLIDTGMLDGRFYPGGRASALEIAGETVTPLY